METGRTILKVEKNYQLLVNGTNDAEKTLYDEFHNLLVLERLPQILHTNNQCQDTGLATKQTSAKTITLTLKHRRSIKNWQRMI